jgi:hypothetical protein
VRFELQQRLQESLRRSAGWGRGEGEIRQVLGGLQQAQRFFSNLR